MTTTDQHATGDALRCSNAERERTSSALHEATGEGRLTLEETEERLAKVYVAQYRAELDALTADLPNPEPVRTGWAAVATLARQQLVDDVAAFSRRGPGELSTRTRVLYALAALAVVLSVVAMVVLVLHGILGEGAEHHGLGQD